jgi:hypothetical protein
MASAYKVYNKLKPKQLKLPQYHTMMHYIGFHQGSSSNNNNNHHHHHQACQSQASWGRLGTQITDLNNLKIRQHIAGKFNNKNLSNGYTEIDTVQVA